MQKTVQDPLLSRFEAELNPVQFEAVTHTESPLLVLAGAGSGKTRVITYRIAYLISVLGYAPWNVLAVTFTNKAANEMRERVAALLNGDPRGLWIGTFHAICARLLRREGEALAINPNFTIYDAADQLAAVKQAMSICDISSQEIKAKTLQSIISNAKNRFEFPDDFAANVRDYSEQLAARVYRQYQEILRKNQALDFDDLLMQAVRLLMEKPEVAETYRSRLKHVLVDEYQDTNHPQYLLLRELAKKHQNICAVGDDDQSIYSWRGANIENILGFERDFDHVKVVRLEQNYRSTKTILTAASQLVANNRNRHKKTLWCDKEAGEKIGLVQLPDHNSEAYWVCETIQSLCEKENVLYGDQAIFYRTNAQSRPFEEELIRRGIPYHIVGGMAFYQRKEIKDIAAYARLLVNPADLVSFQRVVNEPKRKLGAKSQEKLFAFADRINQPVLDAALRAPEAGTESGMAAASRHAFHAFARLFKRWREKGSEFTLPELLRLVFIESGYKEMLEKDKDPQNEARKENIEEFINAAADFESEFQAEASAPVDTLLVLQEFLENVTLVSETDTLEGRQDRLVLMTLHGAKGLEFPYVFLTGMEDNLLPHDNAKGSDKKIEEERRLCYVGITRAMQKLYLTFAESRRIYGQQEWTLPSRFLDEIPQECIEKVAWGPMYAAPGRMDPRTEAVSESGKDDEAIVEGDMVTHRSFGFGVVTEVEGKAGHARITVDFQRVGQKILVQQYARLQKV